MSIQTNPDLRRSVIYELYVRSHTPQGTFRAVEPDLPRIRALGTDILWLMPIHPIGQENRKGSMGCPYANRDYRTVNPEYGTLEDFLHLVDTIHDNGMKCIIDVVYNHTSPDSVLAQTHPEWFFRDEQGRPSREVAAELGICIDTLRSWLKAAGAPSPGQADRQNRDARRLRELEAEIRALRKKLEEKDGVIDILKKSVGILSKP